MREVRHMEREEKEGGRREGGETCSSTVETERSEDSTSEVV
jgi:hypothetical protein